MRFLSRLASLNRRRRDLEERRTRRLFSAWRRLHQKFRQQMDLSEEVHRAKVLRKFFAAWSVCRSSQRLAEKVLRVVKSGRRAGLRGAWAVWRQEIAARQRLQRMRSALGRKTKERIIRKWREVIRYEQRMNAAETAVRSRHIRPFFVCWRKKVLSVNKEFVYVFFICIQQTCY